MPIYEYRCEDCGHEFDVLQKVSDDPLTDCPECGRPSLKKLISAAGFRLKGTGWYETDFKRGGGKRNLHGEGGTGKADKEKSEKKDSSKESKAGDTKTTSTSSSTPSAT